MLLDSKETISNETPYAWVKLQEAARGIKQAMNELPVLRKRLEKHRQDKPKAREVYNDIQNQHRRLLGSLDASALSLLEMEQDEQADYSVKLGKSLYSFNLLTPSYDKLCAALSSYIANLPLPGPDEADNTEAQTTNNRIIGRLMNNVKMGYFPSCPENMAHIVRGIEFPADATTNLLDPCCGCGLALQTLAEGAAANGCETKTFGIELDGFRAEEAQGRLDRVGFGSFYHSRISNEAFHAMLLNPPYLWTITEGGNNTRSEKRFLVDSINNLIIGGLLIYIIPFHRLTADIARVLCDNFADLSLWKFAGGDFKRFKQIVVFGTRQKRTDGSALVSALSSQVLAPDTIPELTELPAGRYQLPATVKDVALFKGSVFNEGELLEQLSRSASFSKLFTRSKLDNAATRPLLPLSLSQVGLVAASGRINGLIECASPHVLKGRIVKSKNTRHEENHNTRGDLTSTTLTETISNKLVLNILTPQGFMALADYANPTNTDTDNGPGDDTNSRLGHSASYNPTEQSDTTGAALFSLGRTVVTANANSILSEMDIFNALKRHQAGDWGEVCKADWDANNAAIRHGDRILSSYVGSDNTTFWVITESDRSYTTVLLPEDY